MWRVPRPPATATTCAACCWPTAPARSSAPRSARRSRPPSTSVTPAGRTRAAGRGYSLASGVVIGLLCFLGLFGVLDALLPVPAIVPILLYIGLLIGAQAFQAVPQAACRRGRRGDPAQPRAVGQRADRQRAERGGYVGGQGRRRCAQRRGRRLRGAADTRRGRGARRPDPRHDGDVHPRQEVPLRGDRVGRRSGAVVHRPDPRARSGMGGDPEVALGYLFFGIVCLAYSFLPGAKDPVEVDESDIVAGSLSGPVPTGRSRSTVDAADHFRPRAVGCVGGHRHRNRDAAARSALHVLRRASNCSASPNPSRSATISGVSPIQWRIIGALELAGVAGVLAGLLWAPIGIAAAIGLTLLSIGASPSTCARPIASRRRLRP